MRVEFFIRVCLGLFITKNKGVQLIFFSSKIVVFLTQCRNLKLSVKCNLVYWQYKITVLICCKVNVEFYLYRPNASPYKHKLRRSGMARVLKGSHSFNCTPHVLPLTEWTYLSLPSQLKLVLLYRPRRDGRLSWPWVAGWLHTEMSGTGNWNRTRLPISVLIGPDVD